MGLLIAEQSLKIAQRCLTSGSSIRVCSRSKRKQSLYAVGFSVQCLQADKESASMKEPVVLQPQHIYIPAVAIARATFKHSWNKLPVATVAAPDHVCGEARRIGYTGKQEGDLALYRLKVKVGKGLPTMTLPSLYIIENGLFVDYEQWQQERE